MRPTCVALTHLACGIKISTVFLGVDHNYTGAGPAILFETMIFNPDEEYCMRYATWEEALKGHEEAVKIAEQMRLKILK